MLTSVELTPEPIKTVPIFAVSSNLKFANPERLLTVRLAVVRSGISIDKKPACDSFINLYFLKLSILLGEAWRGPDIGNTGKFPICGQPAPLS